MAVRRRSSSALKTAARWRNFPSRTGVKSGAVYEISMTDGRPALVPKIYPQSLPWKMQKEALVSGWLHDRLGVPVPRILLADDTKLVIDLFHCANILAHSKDGSLQLSASGVRSGAAFGHDRGSRLA
jgi:hypothetical protein